MHTYQVYLLKQVINTEVNSMIMKLCPCTIVYLAKKERKKQAPTQYRQMNMACFPLLVYYTEMTLTRDI